MKDWTNDPQKVEQAWRNAQNAGLSRRQFLKALAAVAGTAAGGAMLAACAPAAPTAGPAATTAPVATAVPKPTAITVGIPASIGTLDARRNRTSAGEVPVYLHLYDGLVDLDAQMNPRPRLAESFEAVNPTTWRFRLRSGVKFHNGEDFTAESVKFTIDQYAKMEPPYYYVSQWGQGWPPSCEVESASSVLIKTPKPWPIVPRMLTRFGMLPMKATLDASFPDKPVGTGPYKFVQWIKGDRVILEANPNYWGGAPKISRLTYRTIADNSARLAALEAGEVEVATMLPPDAAKLPTSKFTIFEGPSVSYAQWMFNFRNKTSPIADVRVRKALQFAIDEPGLINGVLSGKAIRAKGPAPDVCFGAADVGGYPKRDVANAKKLLAEAGYGSGFNLVMMVSPEIVGDLEITEAIQQQLKEVGVTAKIEQMEQATYMERRPTANWDIAASGVGAWTGDSDFYLTSGPGQNGYSNPAMTAALEKAGNAVMDPNERARYLKEAEQVLWNDASYLWSYQTVMFNVMTNRLKNAMVLPTGWIYYWKAELTS